MSDTGSGMPFRELVALIDGILEECEDEVPCIVNKLDGLDEAVQNELLVSDLLNAYQIFYFFFRTEPDALIRDRLELEPASSLRRGLLVEETDLLEMFFSIHANKPVIVISDGDKVVASFSGKSSYGQGRLFLENPEYQ
jgi:hypothetical protein